MGIREKYEELKKKYNLPEYDELNKEFEIWDISSKNPFILREIRRYIVEKLEDVAKYLESILYTPDSSLMNLYESYSFTKEELQEIFQLYKKVALLIREADLVELYSTEEKEAEYIRKAFEEWKNIKEKLEKIIKKKYEFWTKDIKYKSPKEYLG